MKRLLFIILSVLIVSGLTGQSIINISPTYRVQTSAPAGDYCAEYQAVYDAMTNKPTDEHAEAQNTFVEAAISHGYWDSLEVFHFYAQDSRSAGESLINWVNPGTYNGQEVSSIAWTTLEGYVGDGSADCIDMVYNPYSHGGKFEKDHASFGIYVRTTTDENARVIMQSANNMLIPRTSNLSYWRIQYGTSSTIANATAAGFYVASRDNSTTINYYKNGNDIGGGTAASVALGNYKFYAVGHPDWYTFSTQQIAAAFIGGALSATMVSNFNTDLEALMDALGKGVE